MENPACKTTRSGSRSTRRKAGRSLFQDGAMASCGSWVTARLASSTSFIASYAATISPSSFSTTTSPRHRARCRACRRGGVGHRATRPGGRAVAGGACQRAARRSCSANYRSPDALCLALSKAELSGWESILEKIRKRANSTAVERFNRESTGVRHHPRRPTEPVEPCPGQRNGRHHRQHTAISVIPGL